jgi:hypothetical protein
MKTRMSSWLAVLSSILAGCSVPTARLIDARLEDASDGASLDGSVGAPEPTATLSATPAGAAAFGDIVVGATSSPAMYLVTNDGELASGAIAISFADSSAGFETLNDACTGKTLAAHASCAFSLTFRPAVAGVRGTTMQIAAAPGGDVSRNVTGNGLVPGAINISSSGFDFGTLGVDATSTKHQFDIVNTGQVSSGIPVPTISGSSDAYFIDSTTCTAPLQPEMHCTVTVRFDPTTVGARPGSLTVTATPGGQDAASLSGIAVATVTALRAGTGSGTVVSSQTGIDCGAVCSADFSSSPVSLIARHDVGSTFSGWSGDCTGAASCTLDLTGARQVTASFAAITPTLTITKAGTGTGTVSSAPPGISCGATCAAEFSFNQNVMLTAAAPGGSSFQGWSGPGAGPCSGSVAMSCTVTMDQTRAITATFAAVPQTLTVTRPGTGNGTVSSSPPGISCGATCSASFSFGTAVMLTAMPSTDSFFLGWSGGVCGGTGTCTVTMTAATTVDAIFRLYCGDGHCNNGETCATCDVDCPPPPGELCSAIRASTASEPRRDIGGRDSEQPAPRGLTAGTQDVRALGGRNLSSVGQRAVGDRVQHRVEASR